MNEPAAEVPISDMLFGTAAASYYKDYMRTAEDGIYAAIYAFMRVASGLFETALVLSVESGTTAFEGELPVDPSGGVLCTNPIAASSLVRIAESALQVTGKAGERQVPGADVAIAHAWGAMLQYHTLMIIGREKG